MLCNLCGSETIKYGTHNGEQVYKCKSCKHILTRRSKSDADLRKEIEKFCFSKKVLDINDIATHFDVSKRTVQRWVAKLYKK